MLLRTRYLERLRPFYHQTDLVKVLTGVRRCGKSVLLAQVADELRAEAGSDHVIALNFELTDYADIRTARDLDRYITERLVDDRTHYVFLDEIQEVEGFEKGVNSLRARGNVSLFISGSNAHMLSGELATYLSGRYVTIPVWPLSYAESLQLRGIGADRASADVLNDYLTWGGMPQRFALGHQEMRAYLRDVFNSVILRDVVQRANLRDVGSLETVLDFVMENLGRVISPTSVSNYFKSQNRVLSTETIYAYLRALTSSLLLNRVRRYDVRGKKVMATLDKYYATDVGILASRTVGGGPGIGDLIENMVFVELSARGYEIFTGKTRTGEIDFVAIKDGTTRYIQVAYLLSDPTVVEREFGAFTRLTDRYPCYVISADPFTQNRDGITHLGLNEFLLNSPADLA
jgi:predicted AAA+ superfamily ATPase